MRIRSRVVLWLALGLTAVAARGSAPFPHQRMGVANGCFVESVAAGDEVRERFGDDAWYRLLQWGAKEDEEIVAGHAVLVFEHEGALWCHDINHGFKKLSTDPALREDAEAVAKEVTAPYVGRIEPRYPHYRRDFRSRTEARAPAPFHGVVESELRDAAIVAERLSRRRPVALLEFTYPRDGELRRGAAVAFVYGGRVCVYTARNGTVPFRVAALNVSNLRQLQEMIRRIHPGATGLRARFQRADGTDGARRSPSTFWRFRFPSSSDRRAAVSG